MAESVLELNTNLSNLPLNSLAHSSSSYSVNPLEIRTQAVEADSSVADFQEFAGSSDSVSILSTIPLSDAAETNSEASTDEEVAMARLRSGRQSATKLIIAVVVFISCMLLFWNFGPVSAMIEAISSVCEWIQHNTLVGALLFIPCEILWILFCIPLTPLEIAAGYAFGLGVGFVVNTIGKLLGSVLSFLVGRHCLRSYVNRTWGSGNSGNSGVGSLLKSLDHALSSTEGNASESLQLLFLIQLAFIPVAIKNYGLSMTSVSLSHFAVTALFGEAPGSLAAVWMGSSSRDLVGLLHGDAPSSSDGSHAKVQVAVDVAGAVSLVLVLGILGRRIRSRLNALEHTPSSSVAPGTPRNAPAGAYARVT